jgi:hypothetical protein
VGAGVRRRVVLSGALLGFDQLAFTSSSSFFLDKAESLFVPNRKGLPRRQSHAKTPSVCAPICRALCLCVSPPPPFRLEEPRLSSRECPS